MIGRQLDNVVRLFSSFGIKEITPRLCDIGGRHGGPMVSALDSGASTPGSSPGRGHCVVFLGKTLYSHSASLHPGVQMGASELLGKT